MTLMDIASAAFRTVDPNSRSPKGYFLWSSVTICSEMVNGRCHPAHPFPIQDDTVLPSPSFLSGGSSLADTRSISSCPRPLSSHQSSPFCGVVSARLVSNTSATPEGGATALSLYPCCVSSFAHSRHCWQRIRPPRARWAQAPANRADISTLWAWSFDLSWQNSGTSHIIPAMSLFSCVSLYPCKEIFRSCN